MFFWCCGRKDELDREDEASFDAERLLSSTEEVVGGAKVAVERVEQMVANPAAAWAQAGQPTTQQAPVTNTGKENHMPSSQASSAKAVASEARALDLPVNPEAPAAKQPEVAAAAVAAASAPAKQATNSVVTGTPAKAAPQPAAAKPPRSPGDSVISEIAAAESAVQETAKAAAAAAASQKDTEASTSSGAGASSPSPADASSASPGSTNSAPKKPTPKKKSKKKKGKSKN